jgi:PAB-dependent poly(A)-specific ribonuclease subunit 2
MTYLSMIEIAPSGEAIGLADAECNIHLWGSPSRIRFAAEVSQPSEFPDPEEIYPHVDWAFET